MKWEIKSDAASETIEAATEDEACAKFAASEGLNGRDAKSLRAELEAMGGWLNVIEIEDTGRQLTEVKVYWDSQDPINEGWAYKAYYSDEHEESGSLELVDPDDLDNAIMEACSMLGVDLTHDDFAKSDEEGGVADWMAD